MSSGQTRMADRVARSTRRAVADDTGMRHAVSDWLLPLLAAAMVFLAALALAGATAAAGLAVQWRSGAAAVATVTLPGPSGTQDIARVLAGSAAVAAFRQLPPAEIMALLKPWLGQDPAQLAIAMPAMFEVRLRPDVSDPGLDARLRAAASGATMQRNGAWLVRLGRLLRSLEACAGLALLAVALVATLVVAVATRAGLATRRGEIEIVHGLGATDGQIAAQLGARITALVVAGAMLGLALVVPVLVSLARLAAPFQDGAAAGASSWNGARGLVAALPPRLWIVLATLPVAAALIGWVTAQATVRLWLRQLP